MWINIWFDVMDQNWITAYIQPQMYYALQQWEKFNIGSFLCV